MYIRSLVTFFFQMVLWCAKFNSTNIQILSDNINMQISTHILLSVHFKIQEWYKNRFRWRIALMSLHVKHLVPVQLVFSGAQHSISDWHPTDHGQVCWQSQVQRSKDENQITLTFHPSDIMPCVCRITPMMPLYKCCLGRFQTPPRSDSPILDVL